MKKKQIKKQIIELRWYALPLYERMVYSQNFCKKVPFDQQLKAQNWQVRQIKTLIIVLLGFCVSSFMIPSQTWQLPTFLVIATLSFVGLEFVLYKRLSILRKAVKLRNKFKKKHS